MDGIGASSRLDNEREYTENSNAGEIRGDRMDHCGDKPR